MTDERLSVIRPSDSIGTNKVKLINTGISEETRLVMLGAGNKQAIFEAEIESEDPFKTQGPTVRANGNIISLFPNENSSDHQQRVLVEEVKSRRNLQECKEMTVVVQNEDKRKVQDFLEGDEMRLVRPILEKRDTKIGWVEFQVVDPSPIAPCQTYIITPGETQITYKTPEEIKSTNEEGAESAAADDEIGQPYSQKLSEDTLDDVVGLTDVKEYGRSLLELYDDKVYKDLKSKYSEDLISKEGSVLLYGPPGCGKTMIVQALANKFVEELDRDVVYMEVAGSDILSKLQGQSEKKIKKVFQEARNKASDTDFTFLFFDEVESLVRDRNSSGLQSSQVSITNEFLNSMNDLPENVLVIAATNMPFKMDSAASRRFHTKHLCKHPTDDEMSRKWKSSLEDVNHKGQLDYDELGNLTEGYTPAEIDDRILGSMVQTDIINEYIDGTPRKITMDYLRNKISNTDPRTIPEYISKMQQHMQQNQMEGYSEMETYIENNSDI
jgi:transitional endoplasmic reticulum ATPase